MTKTPRNGSGHRRFETRDLGQYGALVLLISTAFYIGGPLLGTLAEVTQANVPGAALMFVCPAIAATVIAHHHGTFHYLAHRFRWPKRSLWWLAAVMVMPIVIVLSSWVSGYGGLEFTSWTAQATLALIYVVAALGEEIGWTGFALPRLLRLFGELPSALLLGTFWALWHVIPFAEAGNSVWWIVGQCTFTIVFRVVLVRLSVLVGKTIWPAVICHAAYNFAWSYSPDSGTHYQPWLVAAFTAAAAALLFLARPRRADNFAAPFAVAGVAATS